jgi:hypothetical protein
MCICRHQRQVTLPKHALLTGSGCRCFLGMEIGSGMEAREECCTNRERRDEDEKDDEVNDDGDAVDSELQWAGNLFWSMI